MMESKNDAPSVAPKPDSSCPIVDRTGELLREAYKVAQDIGMPQLAQVAEPETGVQALLQISRDGRVSAVPPTVFDPFRDVPLHRTGFAELQTTDSMIAHVRRYAGETSALFASRVERPRETPRLSITAIYDYLGSGGDLPVVERRLLPGAHMRTGSTHHFPLSREWEAWTKIDGKWLSMVDFSEFLEERVIDVVEPDDQMPSDIVDLATLLTLNFRGDSDRRFATGATLLELSRDLRVHESSVVVEARNLASGEAEVVMKSDHQDASGRPLIVPPLFLIGIPVFEGASDRFRVLARLRYRKTSDGLLFAVLLTRIDEVLRTAFDEAVERVASETGVPLFYGVPEIGTVSTIAG